MIDRMCSRRRIVSLDGVAFSVGAPTLQTIGVLVTAYHGEIVNLVEGRDGLDEAFGDAKLDRLLGYFVGDSRILELLPTVATPLGDPVKAWIAVEKSLTLQRDLCVTSLQLIRNYAGVLQALDVAALLCSGRPSARTEQPALDPLSLGVVQVALQFGISPAEVVLWPVELFLAVRAGVSVVEAAAAAEGEE